MEDQAKQPTPNNHFLKTKQNLHHQRAESQNMAMNSTFSSNRAGGDRQQHTIDQSSSAQHTNEKTRSNTVIKERKSGGFGGMGFPISQTPNLKMQGSDKGLPKISPRQKDGVSNVLNKIFIHGKGATKLRKIANNALKEYRQNFSSLNTPKDGQRPETDMGMENNQEYSFRNFHKSMKTQNNNFVDGYLPSLKSPSISIQQSLIEAGITSPPPLFCKKYHKVMLSSQKNSPRKDHHHNHHQHTSTTHESHTHITDALAANDALVYQHMAASINHLDQSTYKMETFNRAMYQWNQPWNYKDESLMGATKHKIRDQLQIMKEERRLQKYHQELMSLQRKRRIIEQYQTEYNVRLPVKFNSQRCTTSQLHVKLATIYHRDRANNAAIRIQRWWREFQRRQHQSRRYWYMLRGVFKFKYFLRKFRDRMTLRIREFDALINRSALKIQRTWKGYLVRKQYGKILAQKRLERNYQYFYNIKFHLMTSAQCKIAFVWRMNRIKIKLARKKREKEEAAKKKAMQQKNKYYHYNSNVKQGSSSSTNKNASSTIKGGKVGTGATTAAAKSTPAPTPVSQGVKKVQQSTVKVAAVGNLMKTLVSAAQADKAATQVTPKGNSTVKIQDNGATGTVAASGESDSQQNENSEALLKTEKDLEVNGEIDEEKSDEEKEGGSDNDSDLNDKESVNGDKEANKNDLNNEITIQPPVLTKNSGNVLSPTAQKGSNGPTSPHNANGFNNTGNQSNNGGNGRGSTPVTPH